MIATTRGLVILAVIALVLAVVVVAAPATQTVVDRTIYSGGPTELQLGEVMLVKRNGEWRWREPDVRADPSTVDAILTALRARWHRTGAPTGKRRGSLRVDKTLIEIGEPLAGTEQTWIIKNGTAFLIDNWVARALVPPAVELRVRRPFAPTNAIDVDGVRIEGTHRVAPDDAWIDPEVVERFHDAAAAVEIVALDGQRGERGITIGRVTRIGTCGNRILISTPDGDGCVDADAWNALESAARALRDAPLDKRPMPFTPKSLAGDPERVAALQTPGELAPRRGKPTGTLVIDGITFELFPDGVARKGEPMMIRTPHVAAIARAFVDTTRWREDAMTIQSISVDGKTFTRGAVVGEWTGAKDPALVEALASTLAVVRAPGAKPTPTRQRISVTFAPPTGAPSTHTIEIGANCRGRIDGEPVVVPPDLCTAAAALQ